MATLVERLDSGEPLPKASEYSSLSAFARLDVEPSYELDLSEVEQRHLELSQRLHPDRFAKRGAKERVTAVALTASLNDAYSTLRDPVRRAEALMALLGGPDAAEDKRTPPGFLMEMLDLRERLDEAKAAGESGREVAQAVLAEVEPRLDAELEAIRVGFSEGSPDLVAQRLRLNTLKYYENLIAEARGALEPA